MKRRRQRMSRKKSKRVFKKGIKRIHKKNVMPNPMRGGIRL